MDHKLYIQAALGSLGSFAYLEREKQYHESVSTKGQINISKRDGTLTALYP